MPQFIADPQLTQCRLLTFQEVSLSKAKSRPHNLTLTLMASISIVYGISILNGQYINNIIVYQMAADGIIKSYQGHPCRLSPTDSL